MSEHGPQQQVAQEPVEQAPDEQTGTPDSTGAAPEAVQGPAQQQEPEQQPAEGTWAPAQLQAALAEVLRRAKLQRLRESLSALAAEQPETEGALLRGGVLRLAVLEPALRADPEARPEQVGVVLALLTIYGRHCLQVAVDVPATAEADVSAALLALGPEAPVAAGLMEAVSERLRRAALEAQATVPLPRRQPLAPITVKLEKPPTVKLVRPREPLDRRRLVMGVVAAGMLLGEGVYFARTQLFPGRGLDASAFAGVAPVRAAQLKTPDYAVIELADDSFAALSEADQRSMGAVLLEKAGPHGVARGLIRSGGESYVVHKLGPGVMVTHLKR